MFIPNFPEQQRKILILKTYTLQHIKGITVIGTGDFTHPGWFAEIKEKLVPAEPGIFKLKEEISKVMR